MVPGAIDAGPAHAQHAGDASDVVLPAVPHSAGGAEFCVMPFKGKLNKESDAYQAQFGNGPKATVDSAALQEVVLDAS